MLHTLKNVNHIFLAVFLINLRVLMINLASKCSLQRKKNVAYKFIEIFAKK